MSKKRYYATIKAGPFSDAIDTAISNGLIECEKKASTPVTLVDVTTTYMFFLGVSSELYVTVIAEPMG